MKNIKEETEENKYNYKRGLVVFIFGIILLILCLWSMGIFSKDSDALKFYSEYGQNSDIKENNLYDYSSKEEVLDLLDHKTGVLYFGFPNFPLCQSMVSVLNDTAVSNKYETIYYYNIKNDRDTLSLNSTGEVITDKNSTAFYRELLKELDGFLTPYTITDSEGKEVDAGEKRIYVPLVLFVKDGKVMYSHEATVKSQEDPKTKLNDKQKNELITIYQKGFDLIK